MHYAHATNAEIAEEVGRHRATIGRELARNSVAGEYRAVAAHEQSRQWRRCRRLVRKIDRHDVDAFVRSHLVRYWSPDQIAGRSKRDFCDDRCRQVPHQTIYAWIHAQPTADREHFTGFLRFAGRRRPGDDRRGRTPNQVSIEGRPQVVDARRRYGDWEEDTTVGARCSGAVVTLVERKSSYLLAAKSCDCKARRVAGKIQSRLGRLSARLRRTATFDNGKEFAEHQRLSERLGSNVYFAQPYRSWQRGTNEHTNGLLRQFLPKGTDLRSVSWQELQHYAQRINDRPRKRLGYRTAAEVFEPLVAIESGRCTMRNA
jgi:IS30 family transposase